MRLTELRELRRQYPGNIFIEREYQNRSMRFTYPPAIIDEYRKLSNEHPNDPLYLYLYSRSLFGSNTPEAIRGFEKTLQLSPGMAWAHLELAAAYSEKPFEDQAKVQANLEGFMKFCPNSLALYDHLREVKDMEFLKKAASNLRALLASQSVPANVSSYNTLWELEFRVAGVADHDKVRQLIQQDIARLSADPQVTGSVNGLWALKEGCKLAGDKNGQQRFEQQILAQFPASNYAERVSDEQWEAANPEPDSGQPEKEGRQPEKEAAYYRALLEHADSQLKLHPKNEFAWLDRFEAVTKLKDVPVNEVEETADHMLAAVKADQGYGYAEPPFEVRVAQAYLDRNVRLDQIPGLIEDGIKDEQARIEDQLKMDLLPSDFKKLIAEQVQYTEWRAWPMLAAVYLKMNQSDKAQAVVALMEDALAKNKPSEKADDRDKRNYRSNQATYWESKGRLAEAGGHKPDALAFYQRSIALAVNKKAGPESDSDDSVTARAARIWKELGGSGEGLQALIAPNDETTGATSDAGWQKMAKPLPAFELADLSGKKWSLSDLKGKVAFVNVWATWCGPCKMELPHLQKLYDRVKDRKDVVVLSMNVDENTGMIEPYVKEHAFSFPVVPALGFMQDFLSMISIPRNWIVTPDGTLREEQVGFSGDGDKWVDEAMKEIEKAKAN